VDFSTVITPVQIRAGRGLLEWTQGGLANRAGLSVVTLNRIESDQIAPGKRTPASIRSVSEGKRLRDIGNESEGFGVAMRPKIHPENPTRGEDWRDGAADTGSTSRSMRVAE
jgi:DNA-binding XRE family transcriptional regulator